MGKKAKAKLKKAAKAKLTGPVSYTKDERNTKVSRIMVQLMQIQMDHVITDEIREKLFNYINTGEPYVDEIDLPQYSRVLQIHFVNDKTRDKENSINIVFKKIRVEDDSDPVLKRKANQLNELQEGMFDVPK